MHRLCSSAHRCRLRRRMLCSSGALWIGISGRGAWWRESCLLPDPSVAVPVAGCACVAPHTVEPRVAPLAGPPPAPRPWLHRVAACPFYGSCRVSSGAIAVVDPLLRERRQCGCNWQPQRRNVLERSIVSAAPSPAVPSARPYPPMRSQASTPALRAARRAAARSVASAPAR